ncbi:MAG: HAMP domain-containing sensor histidine kinase [Chloroflexota bacterium]
MWQKLFNGPWPDSQNLLPLPVQQQAAQRIRQYWQSRGWQLVLGEVILWVILSRQQQVEHKGVYELLAGIVAVIYIIGSLRGLMALWLVGGPALFMVQGMLIKGLGAVTALSFIMPYTFAGMLLTGRRRIFVQAWCMVAFWISLLYEVLPLFPHLDSPDYIVVSYNILLGAFTFQTLRFLNQLAVELNSAYVAEEVRQQSQHFLARVSHELRTPLNSIIGFAKLLRRGEFSETQTHYLQQIIDESGQLNNLVSDLLDSAHLSTGKLTLNLEACDVNSLCASVAQEQRPTLAQSISLNLDLAPNLPPIQADTLRLRQAVGNLMANAVKYTAQGSIALRTYQLDDAVCIEVQDTGIGIPESQHELVFIPFVQLDSRRTGVGLGLDIAAQIVRLHGGSIRLQSIPQQGSTFTVELPLKHTQKNSDASQN